MNSLTPGHIGFLIPAGLLILSIPLYGFGVALESRTATPFLKRFFWQSYFVIFIAAFLFEFTGTRTLVQTQLDSYLSAAASSESNQAKSNTYAQGNLDPTLQPGVGSPLIQTSDSTQAEDWRGYYRTCVWVSGFVTLLLFLKASFQALLAARLVRGAKPLVNARIQALLQSSQSSMQFHGQMQLLVSDLVQAPSAVMGFPNALLLPGDFEGTHSEKEIQVIFAHEISHLIYRDEIWFRCADFLCFVFWWNPIHWLARRRFRLACEMNADVSCHLFDSGPVQLSQCLLKTARKCLEQNSSRPWAMAIHGDGFRSTIGKRIEAIHRQSDSKNGTPVTRAPWWLPFSVVIICLALFATMGFLPRTEAAPVGKADLINQSWWQRLVPERIASDPTILRQSSITNRQRPVTPQQAFKNYLFGWISSKEKNPSEPTLGSVGSAQATDQNQPIQSVDEVKDGEDVEKFYTRTYQLNSQTVTRNLHGSSQSQESISQRLVDFLEKHSGLDLSADGKAVYFNDGNGMLLVRAAQSDLEEIEKVLSVLNHRPEQVTIEVLIYSLQAEDRSAMLDWIFPPITIPGRRQVEATEEKATQGIFNEEQSRVIKRALAQRKQVEVLSAPRVTTLSGRQAQITVIQELEAELATGDPEKDWKGIKVDLLPVVQSDGFNIQCTMKIQMREVEYQVNGASRSVIHEQSGEWSMLIPDGHSCFIGELPLPLPTDPKPKPSPSEKTYYILVTTMQIDPAGNRVHPQ